MREKGNQHPFLSLTLATAYWLFYHFWRKFSIILSNVRVYIQKEVDLTLVPSTFISRKFIFRMEIEEG